MNSILSSVGGAVSSAGSTVISYAVSTAANYVLDYVNGTALPSFFYEVPKGVAEGTGLGLRFSGKITSIILSKVNPKLGETSRQMQTGIGFAAAKADELATDHLFDKCYRDFTPAEMTGPLLWTAFCGWMSAKSLHRIAIEFKMLATGERAEMIRKVNLQTPGAHVSDQKFKPHSGPGLGVSVVRNLILAPFFAGMGYYTEQGIVNRLTGLGANGLPVPAITLTAAAIYAAVQFNAWLMSKENKAAISIEVETEKEPTATSNEE